MKEFLYWSEVQRGLSDHVARGGKPISFYDMAQILWKNGAAHRAGELPKVSFRNWNINDLEEFDRLYGQTPVDMSIFYQDFQQNTAAVKASEPAAALDVIPYKLAYDQALGLHWHAAFEVIYVMEGEARLECGVVSRPLVQGTLCIISPGFLHDVVPERGSQVISITLAGPTVENTLYKLLRQESVLTDFFHAGLDGENAGYMIFFIPEGEGIRAVLRSLFQEYHAGEEYAQQVCADYVEILFAQMLRQCGGRYEELSGNADRQGTPLLAILKYIQTNYATTSLNEVAERFHYEPSYLGKRIKASTGKNYTDIVRALRIDEAKRLLRTTDLSLDDVAERAGYESRVHFFRSFRTEVGQTPGEYRKEKTFKKE